MMRWIRVASLILLTKDRVGMCTMVVPLEAESTEINLRGGNALWSCCAALSAGVCRGNSPIVQVKTQLIESTTVEGGGESRGSFVIREVSIILVVIIQLFEQRQALISTCLTERRVVPKHAPRPLSKQSEIERKDRVKVGVTGACVIVSEELHGSKRRGV
jgi:hypothetical protein